MDQGSRLRHAMALRPDVLSAEDLAARSKQKGVTVRAYVSGTRNAPLDKCIALGKTLGVNGQWLFNGSGPKLPQEPPVEERPEHRTVDIPLIDMVSAGKLTNPSSQLPMEDIPLLTYADLGPGEFFALRVAGTSMDRVSPDGSVIVVNRQDRTLVSGKCYVFSHRGETTFKRWQGGDPEYLEPFSTDGSHKPIFIRRKRDIEVIGRVKRTVLDL